MVVGVWSRNSVTSVIIDVISGQVALHHSLTWLCNHSWWLRVLLKYDSRTATVHECTAPDDVASPDHSLESAGPGLRPETRCQGIYPRQPAFAPRPHRGDRGRDLRHALGAPKRRRGQDRHGDGLPAAAG